MLYSFGNGTDGAGPEGLIFAAASGLQTRSDPSSLSPPSRSRFARWMCLGSGLIVSNPEVIQWQVGIQVVI